jgi:fructose-1,6-bisphosphatase/inositol monophosphatase family enzyme
VRPDDLERACLEAHDAGTELPLAGRAEEPEAWLPFVLGALLDAGQRIRSLRLADLGSLVREKGDGSPSTPGEVEVEEALRARLVRAAPGVPLVGEETGGASGEAEDSLRLALDPVDGTWALLSRTETLATSLVVLHGARAIAAGVLNPATGELAYAAAGKPGRILQLAVFGEPPVGTELPLPPVGDSPTLVNVHPSRRGGGRLAALQAAWERSEIRMVRGPGGSPAWGLVEAAKGAFVYLCGWGEVAAEPWDLAAGVMLVRAAGGEVTDLTGAPVEPLGHTGPFLAGTDPRGRERVLSILRDAQT